MPRIRLAPPLTRGDVIRIVAPSSPFDRDRFHASVAWLEGRGYRVRFRQDIFDSEGYLAGCDDRRREELKEALTDEGVSAVFAARGGYGLMRLLPRRGAFGMGSPRILMGYSDLTPLLNHVAVSQSIVTVHGPLMAGERFMDLDERRRDCLFHFLESGEQRTLRANRDFRVLREGSATGPLLGGNLSLVAASVGTRYRVSTDGAILFIEETREPNYRIDRMMAHLFLAGVFDGICALVLGDITDSEGVRVSDSWIDDMIERYVPENVPVLAGLPAGHEGNLVWLPFGGICSVRTKTKEFRLCPLVRRPR